MLWWRTLAIHTPEYYNCQFSDRLRSWLQLAVLFILKSRNTSQRRAIWLGASSFRLWSMVGDGIYPVTAITDATAYEVLISPLMPE
ncbi:hypothetical protein E4U30_005268 [Claviceps sp. LM220 group G6]|nr:hypothetical protein E4U30_005268 [Claviceps sp. LM220 group G6]